MVVMPVVKSQPEIVSKVHRVGELDESALRCGEGRRSSGRPGAGVKAIDAA